MASATYTLISSQVLGSTASTVTFSSIPQTYSNLKLVMSLQDTASGSNSGGAYVSFNGDSGSVTTYSYTYLSGQSGAAGSSRGSNYPYFALNNGISSASNTNLFTSLELYIPNYTSTSPKQAFNFSATENNSATQNVVEVTANLYRGGSAITSIQIAAAVSYATNSSFYLYGINNS